MLTLIHRLMSFEFLETSNQSNEVMEGLIYVQTKLGRTFHVGHSKTSGHFFTLVLRDQSLMFQICLVADQQHGEFISIFDPENESMETEHFFEAVPIGNGEDQQESLTRSEILLSHRAEFLLTRRVEHLQFADVLIDEALLRVRIFNGRIIISDEILLDKLNGER